MLQHVVVVGFLDAYRPRDERWCDRLSRDGDVLQGRQNPGLTEIQQHERPRMRVHQGRVPREREDNPLQTREVPQGVGHPPVRIAQEVRVTIQTLVEIGERTVGQDQGSDVSMTIRLDLILEPGEVFQVFGKELVFAVEDLGGFLEYTVADAAASRGFLGAWGLGENRGAEPGENGILAVHEGPDSKVLDIDEEESKQRGPFFRRD